MQRRHRQTPLSLRRVPLSPMGGIVEPEEGTVETEEAWEPDIANLDQEHTNAAMGCEHKLLEEMAAEEAVGSARHEEADEFVGDDAEACEALVIPEPLGLCEEASERWRACNLVLNYVHS